MFRAAATGAVRDRIRPTYSVCVDLAAAHDSTTVTDLPLRLSLLTLLVLLGVTYGITGWLGWRGRLARAGRLGVRTASTLRSDDTFRLANRVAGLPMLAAGAVAVIGGLAAFVMPNTVGMTIAAVIGFVGALLIACAGGLAAVRTAAALPPPRPTSAGCAGCVCSGGGCSVLTREA